MKRLLLPLVLSLVALTTGHTQVSVIGAMPFTSTPYQIIGQTSTANLGITQSTPGAKAPGVLWNYEHVASGGPNNSAFMRYSWWDWDVSGVGHDADQAGWTASGSTMAPGAGWSLYGQGPYFLRFWMRVTAPLLAKTGEPSCDDTQMKWFIWNNFTSVGTDRVILMFHSGAEIGGNESTQTTLQLRAGVSGSWAATLMPNSQWNAVQVGWRWGPESTGYQKIWINNDNEGSPDAFNNTFDDLDSWAPDQWGPSGTPENLSQQFFFGDIANTGSCVREDAIIDIANVEIATAFDNAWSAGGGEPGPPPASSVRRLRLRP